MVNRIWQHHFGRGLVGSPSDFGTHGQKPSHPELLDWLASEFVARGWSVKQMHKLMLLSATYRQVSSSDAPLEHRGAAQANIDRGRTGAANVRAAIRPNPSPSDSASPLSQVDARVALDPDNRLYWRMNRLRLEGEVIRDALLAISGQLNLKMGGPGVFPPIPKEVFQGAKGWSVNADPREHVRRSVYIFVRRNLRFPFLEVFDAPDNNLSCPSRESSTTAPQSLTLLNADEVMRAAKLTAARIENSTKTRDDQITLGYRLVLGRRPSAKETAAGREFLGASPL